jgi:hypothetical protein
VASGLAHHFGLDVSLVRIGFVLFTIVSGIGLPLYLAAWLIMPRAQYWPPVGTPGRTPRSFSSREIALGLVAFGGLLFLFFNGGPLTSIVVPLALIGGGVWLLMQPDSTGQNHDPATVDPAGATSVPDPNLQDTPGWSAWAPPSAATRSTYDQTAQFGTAGVGATPSSNARPPGSPVAPSRRRKLRYLLLAPFLLIPMGIAAIASLVLFGSGSIEIEGESTYRPTTVAAIPSEIANGAGDVLLDLTSLDAAMFENEGLENEGSDDFEPVEVIIDHGVGDITVRVPDDLVVQVDATAGVGDIDIFEFSADGIAPFLSVPAVDPHIDLEILVGAGDVNVERVD